MASKKKKNKDANIEGKKNNKVIHTIIAVLIVLIWLGIFAVLIKLDVGNFGSSVLRPVLKDVPVLKEILPEPTNEEIVKSGEYSYKSLAEAIAYIKELEIELQSYQTNEKENTTKIEELQAEIGRLKIFEESKLEFEETKSKFYEEIVFGEESIDIENYKAFYESIDADNAAKLYKQVVEKEVYDEKYVEYAKTYSSMKPAQAAGIFMKMTSELNTVVGILNNMNATSRGNIMGSMSTLDAEFAAKITKLLAP